MSKEFEISGDVQKIVIPDGYELCCKDGIVKVVEEDSVFDCIVKKLKYDEDFKPYTSMIVPGINNRDKLERLQALNELITYAEYYNSIHPLGDRCFRYTISVKHGVYEIISVDDETYTECIVLFNDKCDCQKTIEFLGNEKLHFIYSTF